MTRVLLLGSAGQLGVELVESLAPDFELTALTRAEADLTSEPALRAAIRAAEPAIVINAAAYTAVDRAESEPSLARAVNSAAPRIVAQEALRANAWLLHFSTDYVFDGSGDAPWKETDPTRPLNVYGKSKLEGEKAIAAAGCRHLIFRTSWVYASHGNNFLRTMLRLGQQRPSLNIVDDQVGAPTSTNELARAIRAVLHRLEDSTQRTQPGIYHMTCAGATTWFRFASAIFAGMAGLVAAPELNPISTRQYPTPAARPHNSRLNCQKLDHAMGIHLANWEDALAEVIQELHDAAAAAAAEAPITPVEQKPAS